MSAAEGPSDPSGTRTNLDPSLRLTRGSVIAGRYRVVDSIGIGGMGRVYRVVDEELGVEVALKLLRPELAEQSTLGERFRRELLLGRKVSHRNVVRIHDLGADGELSFMTMDLVEGQTLRQLLEQRGRLEIEQATELFRQMVEGLAAAHAEGVVHRDLKPSNILIDAQGRAYITDFGIARSVTSAGLTESGTVLGTPDYLSPEQALGEPVDGRSDLYTMGLILFEMITAERPFPAKTGSESLAMRLHAQPRTIEQAGVDVPPRLVRIVERCLEREPERRYASAEELLADLAGEPEAPRASVETAAGPPPRRQLAIAAGVLAVLALVAVISTVVLTDRRDEAETTTGTVTVERRALAVLPLRDESGREDLAWAATAVAEMLRSRLNESPRLEVVDDERVRQTLADLKLEDERLDQAALRQLADLFDADRLVVGAIRASGDELWAELTLEDPGGDGSAPFMSRPTQLSELAAGIGELEEQILAQLDLPAAPSTASAEPEPMAMPDFAAGLEAMNRGDSLAAADLLQKALELDPELALGWLRLAEVYRRLGRIDDSVVAVDRALESLPPRSEDSRLALGARATRALSLGDLDRAVAHLESLLERFPGDVEASVLLGDVLGQAGRMPEAVSRLRQVAEQAPDHPRAWYLLSKYSILAGDSRTAADEYLVRAMVIQNKLKNPQGRADVMNAYGVAYRNLGQLDLAEENYRQSAQVREEIGDLRGLSSSLRNLSLIATLRGAYDRSRESLERALGIAEQLGDEAGIAAIENDLGVLAEEQGLYREALEYFRSALARQRDLGDQRAVANSLNNVGYAYYLLGDYDSAAVYSQQALDDYREDGNRRGEALTLQTIGQLQRARGDWQESSASYLAALEAAREIELAPAEAAALGDLGRVAHLQGRYAKSLEYYDEALSILERIDDARGRNEFQLAKGEVLLEIGDHEAAVELLDRAAAQIEDSGNSDHLAQLAWLRGVAAQAEGRASEASSYLEDAARHAQASNAAATQLMIDLERADSLEDREQVLEKSKRLGDLRVLLRAEESIAARHLERGDAGAAEQAARGALRRLESAGTYGRAFRLYRQLARALDLAGEGDRASRFEDSARQEIERVRAGLSPPQQAAFRALHGGPEGTGPEGGGASGASAPAVGDPR